MKVVSFVNMKGGVAKITLAMNVADCLVRRHDKTVLVVDIDPQFNATQCLLSGTEYVEGLEGGGHTILEVLMTHRDDIFRGHLTAQEPIQPDNIRVITCVRTAPAGNRRSENCHSVL